MLRTMSARPPRADRASGPGNRRPEGSATGSVRSVSARAFAILTSEDEGRVCRDIPDSACREEPRSFLTHVVSLAGTKIADGLVDPKLVLSWLLATAGAPAAHAGLLVPVREAGALLPQLFTAASIRAMPKRKGAWAAGSIVQGLCALGLAAAAFTLEGATLGATVVGLVAVLALARSVCSVAYKDVLGKTVSKSRRGTATGTAGSVAAGFLIVFGALLAHGLVERLTLVQGALLLAGLLWIASGVLFATLDEAPGATEGGGNAFDVARENLALLRDDPQLVRFIAARGLLTATALAPPFMVALVARTRADAGTSAGFGGVGLLVIASAFASLVSGYVWGRLSDRSSRLVLVCTGLAGAVALAATAALGLGGVLASELALTPLLFGLMIAYEGVRLGRSTHVVDMASAETRAAYTALSNTIIGVLLLGGGVFGFVASRFGEAAVLGVMAGMCALAVPVAWGLEEVQAEDGA